MIRVLVAEDSAVTREYLVHLLAGDPAIEVAGTVADGREAVEQAVRLRPDVVVMDVHMPEMSGYEATRRIMERAPIPIVMVSASLSRDEAGMAFAALAAGALTVVDKPPGPGHPGQAEAARLLIETVKVMAEVKVVRRWPSGRRPVPPSPLEPRPDRPIRLIAVGASTGGPQALVEILGDLPASFAAPILVVQHISPGFTPGLVDWLGQAIRLPVTLGDSGEAVRPGVVYLAREGAHMGITREGRIRLAAGSAEDGFCPSASRLFHSVAESYGPSAMGILLTGMGRDGAAGLRRLREAGGLTIVQDEESSVVFGMPAEAIRLGAAAHVLPPERIAGILRSLATSG